MSAQIHQGALGANIRTAEFTSAILSFNTFPHATKSLTLSPREKGTLEFTWMNVGESQGRKKNYKVGFKATWKVLETDFPFLKQLYYYMQQPCQGLFKTAKGEFYSFVANATTNAAQVQGGATGTSLGTPQFVFTHTDKERYVEITFSGEMSPVEYRFMQASVAAALTGVATEVVTAGTLANAAGGESSYKNPGFIGLSITNTGGTALAGKLGGNNSLVIKSEGVTVRDGIIYGQKLAVQAKFMVYGLSSADGLAWVDDTLENVTVTINDRNGQDYKFVNVLSVVPNLKLQEGTTDGWYYEVEFDGWAVQNPDDSAVAPLPNIDIGQNAATEFLMNLVNN